MKLSSYVHGRDNNFNLLRLLSAFAVLYSHSFIVATGVSAIEPGIGSLQVSHVAVDIFFITSGFLVTGSLLLRKSTIAFVSSRVLRIYPALFLMVLISVFILGVSFTSLPVGSFLQNPVTHIFAFKNITLWFGTTGNLPGVFEANPYPKLVNVSLWTLPFEVRMYGILAVMWSAFYILGRLRDKAFAAMVLVMAIGALFIHFRDFFKFHEIDHFHRLLFMFFTGASFYVLKNWITLSSKVFFFVFLIALLSSINKEAFFVVYHISLAYMVFWVAYVPNGNIRKFNRVGDYSYGVYIYAFPVSQSIVALIPGISVGALILLSSILAIFLAFLSWHSVEKHALKLKPRFNST